MKRTTKKVVAILLVAMFMLTLLPATGFAASTNSVDRVPQVSVNHVFDDGPGTPVLSIEEKDATVFSNETIRLSLTNAEWWKDDDNDLGLGAGVYPVEELWAGVADVTDVNVITRTLVELTITGPAVSLPLWTKVTGEGNVQVTIDARDSRVSSGTLTFAVSAPGRTITSIDRVVTFARTGSLGVIQVDETRINALGSTTPQSIRMKLPPRFSWVLPAGYDKWDDVVFSGGLTGEVISVVPDGRDLTVTFGPVPSTRDARGSIFLRNLQIRADRDAPYGDVVADVEGTNVTSQDLLIARYQAYNVEGLVAEVKEVTAGRYDNRTAKITIRENIPGSMIAGRELTMVLPDWVKINEVRTLRGFQGLSEDDLEYANRKNEIFFIINEALADAPARNNNSRYEFELDLSVQADKSGDIIAEIFGAGMEMQELVIATAVAPITAQVAASDLKIGVQNQDAPDIIITETKRGMIDDGTTQAITAIDSGATPNYYGAYANYPTASNVLTVTLPRDHDWSARPTIEVTEGNLELGSATISANVLSIPVRSTSTQPSTIKISDVKVTLDRTVPEGAFYANIGGTAIVKNHMANATLTTPVLFDMGRVVRFQFANVVTPAPGEMRAITTFTIGSMTYTREEAGVAVEYEMDVAPYIMDGRTYLPVRYVAYALNVGPGNILWDAATQTVTIFKGDRIVQMVIGSNNLLVNGVNVTMDVPAVTVDGRTMLPVRWVAQAFGAQVDWDAATQTVTVTQ